RPVELGLTDEHVPAGARDSSSSQAPNERMRRRSWKPQQPGEQVPDGGARQCGKNHILSNLRWVYQAPADRLCHCSAKDESRNKVEGCGPDNREAWRKDTGGNHRCNTVGGIVKAIQEVERKRDGDGDNNQQ